MRSARTVNDSCILLARMYSAFHPSGVGIMSRGNSLFGGTSLGPSPRVLKELGPTRGLPPANWGVRTYMPCMLVAGLALQSNDWGQVCQGQLSLPSFRGRYMSWGGTLGLTGGNSWALPRALNLGAIAAGQGATTVLLW